MTIALSSSRPWVMVIVVCAALAGLIWYFTPDFARARFDKACKSARIIVKDQLLWDQYVRENMKDDDANPARDLTKPKEKYVRFQPQNGFEYYSTEFDRTPLGGRSNTPMNTIYPIIKVTIRNNKVVAVSFDYGMNMDIGFGNFKSINCSFDQPSLFPALRRKDV